MSVVATPPHCIVDIRYVWDPRPLAQGQDGRMIERNLESLIYNWLETKSVMSMIEPDAEEAEIGYRHLPLQIAGVRHVKYIKIEQVKPRRIIPDELD